MVAFASTFANETNPSEEWALLKEPAALGNWTDPVGTILIEGASFTMGQMSEFVTAPRNSERRTVTVNSFYMDKHEVSNGFWKAYERWVSDVFGAHKRHLVESVIPDSTVWRDEMAYNDPLVEYYYRHKAYSAYPVVGVTWEQAVRFCQWRTDRENEKRLQLNKILTSGGSYESVEALYAMVKRGVFTQAEKEYFFDGGRFPQFSQYVDSLKEVKISLHEIKRRALLSSKECKKLERSNVEEVTFYQIPYDVGEGRQLKFDLDEFCRHFSLQRASAHYAMVYIERTGHWTLSEDVDISTKVQAIVERNDLYDIELPDSHMAALLELLMRRYTGLFSFPVPIDEEYVAGYIGVTVPMLRQLLYQMSVHHIIRYVPCDKATVLYLHHDRLRPKNVNLDPGKYAMLKESFTSRMQKMLDYVAEEDVCRSSYLLEYFGQTESADCGTCDVCRAAKSKAAGPVEAAARLSTFINHEKSGVYVLEDIPMELIPVLRRLIDEGTVPPPQIA